MFNLTIKKPHAPKKARISKREKEQMVVSQVKTILSSDSQNLIVAVKN